jgi:TonB family protein
MNDVLLYFLKVNIAIALFYLFYRLFFAGDTFWKARRYYLLFSILVSLGYPFLSIENWMQKQEPVQRIIVSYASLPEIVVSPNRQTSSFTIENILLAIYFSVVLLLLVKFLIQLISIFRIRMAGKPESVQGVKVIAVEKEISPFSFFNAIYLNPILHNAQETSQILLHEQTHVGQMHSLDVMVSEMLTMMFWFNPAAWLLKREMRQNLEFLADNNVLESGFDSKSYQYHLLQLAYQIPDLKLTNKFNVSPLKKRITMMNKQKTAKARILKYSLIVPLALALVISSNAQTVVSKAKTAFAQAQDSVTTKKKQVKFTPPQTQKSSVKFTPPTITKDKSGIYNLVEKMPRYPGGEKKLMEYVGMNIRYPVEAQKNDQQGTTVAQFVVNAQGKVEKAKILRSISPSLDQEALRVINSMPQWIPGEQSGKKVSVYYTLPITFKLDGGSKPAPDTKNSSIVVVGYAPQASGMTAPKVKEFDSSNPPVFIVDGVTQSKNFDINSIKPETIEKVNVVKPDTEAKKAELVAKYGENAANGVIEITSKK